MIELSDIQAARERLRGVIVPTPMLVGAQLSEDVGCRIVLKPENMQAGGSFKLRGAYNKLMLLTPEQRGRGVIAASMGNHAQGVALSARLFGVPATIVMPEEASLAKITATERLGATVVLHGASFDDAMAHARALQQEHDYTFVHAFDDLHIISGQGVVGLEILDDAPDVDTIIVPIGGGGLIAGIACAVRALRPATRIIGVQAAGCATVHPSLAAGEPVTVAQARTIADGIAVKRPGDITLPLIRDLVDEVVTVSEDEIANAVFYTLQQLRLVVEGAGAVGVAALLSGRIAPRPEEQVCVVLSGGNIDANLISRLIDQSLTRAGRYIALRTSVPDKPGNLSRLTQCIAAAGANVIEIQHRRSVWGVPLDHTGLEMILEVRDAAHGQAVEQSLASAGYVFERIGHNEFPVVR